MKSSRISGGLLLWGKLLALLILTIVQGNRIASASSCVEEQAGKIHECSAKDVRVTFADNVRDIFGAPLLGCAEGKKFSFVADFHVQTTATARYDVGLYFSIDGDPNGDGAASGACSAHMIKDRHMDPQSPNAVMLGALAAVNLDGDACRDLSSAHGWRNIGGKIVTLRIDNALCHDSDGDGKLNLPNCTTWSNNAGAVCSSPENTVATSASSCSCDDGFNMPIAITPSTILVTETEQQISLVPRKSDRLLLSESASPQHREP